MRFKEWLELESFNTRLRTIQQKTEPIVNDFGWDNHKNDFEVGDRNAYRRCKTMGGLDCDKLYSRYRVEAETYTYDVSNGTYMANWAASGHRANQAVKVLEVHFNRLGREMQTSLTGTGNYMQVMSNVMSIADTYIQKERPDVLLTASGTEPSRIRLYQRLKSMYQSKTPYKYDVSKIFNLDPEHRDSMNGDIIALATEEAYRKIMTASRSMDLSNRIKQITTSL